LLLAVALLGAVCWAGNTKISSDYRYTVTVAPNEDKVLRVNVYWLEENGGGFTERSVEVAPQLVTPAGGVFDGIICIPPTAGGNSATCYHKSNLTNTAFTARFTNSTVVRVGDGRIGAGGVEDLFTADFNFACVVQSGAGPYAAQTGNALTVTQNLKSLWYTNSIPFFYDDFSMAERVRMGHSGPTTDNSKEYDDALQRSRDSSIAGAAFLVLLAIGVVAVLVILILALLLGKRA